MLKSIKFMKVKKVLNSFIKFIHRKFGYLAVGIFIENWIILHRFQTTHSLKQSRHHRDYAVIELILII